MAAIRDAHDSQVIGTPSSTDYDPRRYEPQSNSTTTGETGAASNEAQLSQYPPSTSTGTSTAYTSSYDNPFDPERQAAQYWADRTQDASRIFANAGLYGEHLSSAWAWWNNARDATRRFGASSAQAVAIRYQATQSFGIKHPVTMAVGLIVIGVGFDVAIAKG